MFSKSIYSIFIICFLFCTTLFGQTKSKTETEINKLIDDAIDFWYNDQYDLSLQNAKKALDKSIQRIEDAVMETLSQTPPELAADIYNTGIYLAGGGSMLRGLDKRISQKTDLPVYIAEDPLKAVVRGTGIALKNISKFRSILIK